MLHQPLIFGLTGSIGSGKSTVTSILQELGHTVIDADVLAKEVTARGSDALIEIEEAFGSEYLNKDGELNRELLGRLIFSDKNKKEQLENILHPRIRKLWLSKLEELKKSKCKVIFYSAPLIFESKLTYKELTSIILISAPYEACIKRVMSRNNINREEAKLKIDSQLSDAIKRSRSDFIIDNSTDLNSLKLNTLKAIQILTARFNIR